MCNGSGLCIDFRIASQSNTLFGSVVTVVATDITVVGSLVVEVGVAVAKAAIETADG